MATNGIALPSRRSRPVSVHRRSRRGRIAPGVCRRLIRAIDRRATWLPLPEGEISLAFLDNQEMADWHGQFFQEPTPTDVMTFPALPESGMAGEILVGVEWALQVAQRRRLDPSREIALYIIHGCCHLSGYADLTLSERRQMRKLERRIFANLEEEQPWVGLVGEENEE